MMSRLRRGLRGPVLRTAKALGLFALARRLTRRRLRILCYHGGALADEHRFSPGTFMTGETFARRMAYLACERYPVLPLDEAVRRLDDGTLPDCATAITIDDGWYGTYAVLFPVLRAHGFPATLYVTTYYVAKQTQVFNMLVRYLLWRHADRSLDLACVDPALQGAFALSDPVAREAAVERIEAHAHRAPDACARQCLAERLAAALGHDAAASRAARLFAMADAEEIREMAESGVDIQLHTHRHRLPRDDRAAVAREIADNRAALAPLTERKLVHFCYPSGRYAACQLPWLEALGVETATTTEPGFNGPETPRLELTRFLDSETVSDLEFEAELSGFYELIRRLGVRI